MRALVVRLLFLGGVILGVLRQVAVRARIGDLLDDARPLDLLAMLELVFEHGIARRRHRNLVHQSLKPPNRPSDKIQIAGPKLASGPATAELCPKLVPSGGSLRGCPRSQPLPPK